LDVQAHYGDGTTAFSMALRPSMFPIWEESLERAENQPVTTKLKTFRGVVCDVSGAAIPGTLIRVVRKGTNYQDHVARVKSGLNGQFSAQLSDGTYIAIISASGFQIRLIPFEITDEGFGELKISLTPGSRT